MLLLALVVVLLVVSIAVLASDLGGVLPDSSGRMYVEIEEADVGYVLTPQVLDQPVEVVVNGASVAVLDPEATHEPVPLPVAPGDRVTLVADVGRQRLQGRTWTAASDTGAFVTYHTFEAGRGSTLYDRSEHDNDATLTDPSWIVDETGSGLAFDTGPDRARADDLSAPPVDGLDRFTLAVTVAVDAKAQGGQRIAELSSAATGAYVRLSVKGDPFPKSLEFSVRSDAGTATALSAGEVGKGEVVVLVGTYDGSTLRLYRNGTLLGSEPASGGVSLGSFVLGNAAGNPSSKVLDGREYQVRLYHAAFDEEAVGMLTRIMRSEAE